MLGRTHRHTLGHFDLPMRHCSIALDDQLVVQEGELVKGVFEVAREIALTVPTSSVSKTTLQFKTVVILL